jgi:hypothetical protein
MLRVAGTATGTAGLLGATAMSPAEARTAKVLARLNADVIESGGLLTLHIAENLHQRRRIRVQDSGGLEWTRIKRKKRYQMWTARPTTAGSGTVSVIVRRADGHVHRKHLDYTVTADPIHDTRVGAALIGMSALPDSWPEKVAAVGIGLSARRIFADLAAGATSQLSTVQEAHAAGMLPVISYKVGGDVAGALAGKYDAVAEQAAARLAAFGKPTAVTIWHEPYTDMTGAEFAALHARLMPIFKQGQLKVGPILNGFLLDGQVPTFAEFCPDELFHVWDYFAIDTYEGGTMAAPGARKPGPRIPALSAYLRGRGHDIPIGVGEYNGFSPASITEAGEALLTTPNVWFGCMWNENGKTAVELSGDRLTAFRATVSDPRAGRVVA